MTEYIAIIIAGGGILFLLIAGLIMKYLHRDGSRREFDKDYYAKALVRAAQSLRVREVGPRLAVIDAAKLFDQALVFMGVNGDSPSERIRNYKESLVDPNKVWAVNKEYERLIQEPKSSIDIKRARNAVKAVEAELNKMGAL